jgi:hypothetical protein
VLQAAEGGAVQDAIPVALERGAQRILGFRNTPSAGFSRPGCPGSQVAELQVLEVFPAKPDHDLG